MAPRQARGRPCWRRLGTPLLAAYLPPPLGFAWRAANRQRSGVTSVYERYYEIVRRVPRGRVVTYGQVAGEAGLPGRARQVGYAMAACPDDIDIPWHRVINARGEISRRTGGRSFELLQRALLEGEGVVFDERGRVDLDRFGWRR